MAITVVQSSGYKWIDNCVCCFNAETFPEHWELPEFPNDVNETHTWVKCQPKIASSVTNGYIFIYMCRLGNVILSPAINLYICPQNNPPHWLLSYSKHMFSLSMILYGMTILNFERPKVMLQEYLIDFVEYLRHFGWLTFKVDMADILSQNIRQI